MLDLGRTEKAGNTALREAGAADRLVAAAVPAKLWDIVSGGTAEVGEFYQAWLALQCGMIAGASAGLLLLRRDPTAEAPAFESVAAWPDAQQDLGQLAQVAHQASTERRSIVARCHGGTLTHQLPSGMLLAHPVGTARDGPFAVIAVAVAPRGSGLDPQTIARQLAWGSGWLEMLLSRQGARAGERKVAQAAAGLDLVAVAGEHRRLRASAMAVANELAGRLSCDRVSIGVVTRRRDGVRLKALSHSATFQRRTQAGDAIENAMEEALDQNASVVFPAVASTKRRIAVAHKDLARLAGGGAIVSVVLPSRQRSIGVITLERHRDQPFDEDAVTLCEAVAALVGPLIDLQNDGERWIAGRAVDAVGSGVQALVGPRRWALKLAAIAVIGLAAFFALATGQFTVSAKSVTEGIVQRAAVAPFDGFVQSAPSRAGDKVRAGDVLAALDDKDLVLDAVKARSEREKLTQKYREALAKHDRPDMASLSAQIRQAEAQLTLAQDKLAKTRITAPFDGLVVSGDLSQSLGSPVEKGKVLFEIAPLDEFRINVQVDERDIQHVAVGQKGWLALSGLPAHPLPFAVTKVTPIATAEEGRNYFRVEARLEEKGMPLRPGMEGVGKIAIDRRSLAWIWTHSLIDWLWLTAWKWIP
jgi:RND family efflux transporter MFP subunit